MTEKKLEYRLGQLEHVEQWNIGTLMIIAPIRHALTAAASAGNSSLFCVGFDLEDCQASAEPLEQIFHTS